MLTGCNFGNTNCGYSAIILSHIGANDIEAAVFLLLLGKMIPQLNDLNLS